jgi:hypothetical protein
MWTTRGWQRLRRTTFCSPFAERTKRRGVGHCRPALISLMATSAEIKSYEPKSGYLLNPAE